MIHGGSQRAWADNLLGVCMTAPPMTPATLAPIPKTYRDHTVGYAKGWYYVADSDDVTQVAMLPVSYLDLQLVVYRDKNDAVHVTNAYCPHLGAHLASADGCIEEGEIVCPFHKWRFDTTDGVCASIPYATTVPRKAVLTQYPVMEQNGLVLMWWHPSGGDPEAPPYDGFAVHSDKTWVKHSVQTYETQVPVRDLSENAFDTAHIQQLHTAVDLPKVDSVVQRDFGLELTYAPLSRRERTAVDFQQFNFSGMGIITHVVMGEGFGYLAISTLTPIDRENSIIHNHMWIMDTGSAEQNEAIGSGFADRVRIEITKDLAVLDFKKHVERPVLCGGDGPIMKWRRYANELMSV